MKRMGTGLMLALLVGCSGSQAYHNAILQKAKALRAMPEYVIGNGDDITINVLGHDEFAFSGLVRPDGKISFPGHGDVTVSGKTPQSLRTHLKGLFKKSLSLRDPRVYVTVNTFASKNVTVLGEVRVPGRFPYHGQMRVTDLLGATLGFTIYSSPNRTLLFREVDGNVKIYQIRLNDFLRKGDFSTNFYVRPGDIVFVPRSGYRRVADGIRVGSDPFKAVLETVGIGANTTSYFVPGAGR